VQGLAVHNHHYLSTLQSGQMYLLDAGAETAAHYDGDLSSTCPVDAEFTDRQRDIYEVVLSAHLGAIAALKPGVPFREVHLAACRTMVEGLKALGLMKGNAADAVEQGAHALFFPCGLGHMLGMDVHDMESLGEVWVGYEGQPKSTQFVLTVEPGIYFIPELIRRWERDRHCLEFINYPKLESYFDFSGIRIEENVTITQDGARILGKARPRTAPEIASVRKDG
jgi:Xaa-Pro aminopeptidase